MVELGRLPRLGVMASRALTIEMVSRSGMARLAVARPRGFMVEVDVVPGQDRMASGAVSSEMVCGLRLVVAVAALVGRAGKLPVLVAGCAFQARVPTC